MRNSSLQRRTSNGDRLISSLVMELPSEGIFDDRKGKMEASSSRVTGLGIVIVALIVVSQVCATEISSDSLKKFKSPFFVMYLHTTFMVFMTPMHMIAFGRSSGGYTLLQDDENDSSGSSRVPRNFLRILLVFYPLWVCANYMYALSYSRIAPSITNAVFSSCTAFVSIFSVLLLPKEKKRFGIVRLLSVAFAVGGVLAISLGKSGNGKSSSPSFEGVIFALLASLAAALYKVLLKRYYPAPSPRQVCLFLSTLGAINVVAGMLPAVLLGYYRIEAPFWEPLAGRTWALIIVGSFFTLAFNACITFGIAITNPLFISIGVLLTVPASLFVDALRASSSQSAITSSVYIGAALVCASFALVLYDHRGRDDAINESHHRRQLQSHIVEEEG